jgi:ferritin-like metal-binding protein YciE
VSAYFQNSAGFASLVGTGGGAYSRKRGMAINNAKELFVFLLSDLRRGAESTIKIFHEIGKLAQDREIKEALEARALVSKKILATLDEAFRVIGASPVKMRARICDACVEDFRRELAAIKTPEARRLFILAEASHLVHLRLADYTALISAADVSGHYGAGLLLESRLADKIVPREKMRRLKRERPHNEIARPAGLTARAI